MLKFPDDAAYAGGKKFFVEIYVTHAVDEEKLSKLKQTGRFTTNKRESGAEAPLSVI